MLKYSYFITIIFIFLCFVNIKYASSKSIADYLVAQAVPRSFIYSDDSFNVKEKEDFEKYRKQYEKMRREREEYLQDQEANSYATPQDKIHALSPYADDDETEKRMNERFQKYVDKQKEKDVHVLLGVNEVISGDDADDMMALGFRFSYQDILQQYLNINGKNFYPWVTVGSKGMSISPFSYAVVNTGPFKFYIDPLIPFVNWKQGKMSWGSGVSAGYYHNKNSSWGIEAMYKFLWANPYDDTEYDYYSANFSDRTEKVKVKDGKKRRNLWGVFLVYRF